MQKLSYLIPVFFLLVVDQLSKWAITEHMIRPALGEDYGESLGLAQWLETAPERLPFTSIEFLPFFNIVMVWNQGVSFGLLNGGAGLASLIVSILPVLILIAFGIWLWRSDSRLQSFAISLVIAGAVGNIIDRVRFGAVVDFLDFHAFDIHFPAFNVADSCVCVGVFLLIVQSFFFETAGKNATTNSNTD